MEGEGPVRPCEATALCVRCHSNVPAQGSGRGECQPRLYRSPSQSHQIHPRALAGPGDHDSGPAAVTMLSLLEPPWPLKEAAALRHHGPPPRRPRAVGSTRLDGSTGTGPQQAACLRRVSGPRPSHILQSIRCSPCQCQAAGPQGQGGTSTLGTVAWHRIPKGGGTRMDLGPAAGGRF